MNAMTARNTRPASLLVPQRRDRIKHRGAAGWPHAKQDTDRCCERKRDEDGRNVDRCLPCEQRRKRRGGLAEDTEHVRLIADTEIVRLVLTKPVRPAERGMNFSDGDGSESSDTTFAQMSLIRSVPKI
jgi:hypothetical protein